MTNKLPWQTVNDCIRVLRLILRDSPGEHFKYVFERDDLTDGVIAHSQTMRGCVRITREEIADCLVDRILVKLFNGPQVNE